MIGRTGGRLRLVLVGSVWLGAGLALLAPTRPARAQFGAVGDAEGGDDLPRVFLRPCDERSERSLRQLEEAKRYIEQGNYARAVRLLGAILDLPEDYFLDTRGKESYALKLGLKREVNRLIGAMPRRGRELYELQFGPLARRLLDEAIANRDAEKMAEASRRFFHTQAGYEATFLLGLHQANQGWWPEAALTLDHLRRESPIADRFEPTLSLALAVGWVQVDEPEKARQTLRSLRARRSGPTIEFAGRQIPWFEEGKELEWLGDVEPVLGLTVAVAWLRTGHEEEATKTLHALRDRHGGKPIRIGGTEIPWFDKEGQEVEWLTNEVAEHLPWGAAQVFQWTMYRGDAARNAGSPGGAPLLRLRWRVPVYVEPLCEGILEQLRQTARDHGQPAIPALHPLVVDVKDYNENETLPDKPPWIIDDVVLMRTAQNLLAVDFTTGKRLWDVPVEDDETTVASPDGRAPPNLMNMVQGISRRIWGDVTYGTLSSDGRSVFSIENLGLYHSGPYPPHVIVPGRQFNGLKPYNRLCARDIRTGKLKWPDPRGDEPSEDSLLSRAFFLGPPLPLMGRLYAVVEVNKGEIRLVTLDADKGELAWSQQLAVVETDISAEPERRFAGVSPSFADGILVCPTSVGALVAVDLSTRSLLWSHLLPKKSLTQQDRIMLMQRRNRSLAGLALSDDWIDSSVTISDGRVLVTPSESEFLICLNLIDGSELWREDRDGDPEGDRGGGDLYVACVYQGKVILVGPKGVRAVSLTEGEPPKEGEPQGYRRPKRAWDGRVVKLPGGALPSGRGFRTGDRYFVPLSTGEVVAVDLQKGRITHVSRARNDAHPGNLVCHKGRILSQGVAGVELYDQLEFLRKEVERRLEKQPDDPGALAARAEILLESGNRKDAIEHFRRAFRLDPSPGVREALRTALFEALDEDFAAYRDDAAEIEKLIDEPSQRQTFLRLMAAGYHRESQWDQALQYYEKLIDLKLDGETLEMVDKGYQVRLDRWIQAQLADYRRDAPAENRAELDRGVAQRLQAALDAEGPDALRQFLGYLANHPAAAKARLALADRLAASGDLLEAELLLRCEEASGDVARSAPAVARLANLLVTAKRADDAEDYLARLADDLATVDCLDGKTGKQLAEDLAGKLPEGGSSTPKGGWPKGLVEVTEPDGSKRPQTPFYGRFSLNCQASRPPLMRDMNVMLDQNHRKLVAFDGLGREQWQLSFATSAQQQYFIYNSQQSPATVNGHQLTLVSTQSILAVDMLGSGGPSSAKLLWTHSLQDSVITDPNKRQIVFQAINPNIVAQRQQGPYRRLSPDQLGPVSEQYVCFQRFHKLLAVDPISGDTLWERRDVDPDSVLFGDDRYVLAVESGATKAKVFSALDGRLLDERELPPSDQCMGAVGRRIVVLRREDDRQLLELYDPWQKRAQWKTAPFAQSALTALVKNELFAAYETDSGRFLLVDLQGGKPIVDAKVKPQHNLAEILVYPLGEQIILILHSPNRSAPPANVSVYPMPGASSKQIMHGTVYAFDRAGKSLWKEPTEIENQHFLLGQPSRLPVMVFASRVRKRENNRSRYVSSILCIDKRTGRVVVDDMFPKASSSTASSPSLTGIVGDPNEHSVEVRLSTATVTLAFTDKPVTEKPAKPAAPKEPEQTEKRDQGEPIEEPPEKPAPPLEKKPAPTQPAEKAPEAKKAADAADAAEAGDGAETAKPEPKQAETTEDKAVVPAQKRPQPAKPTAAPFRARPAVVRGPPRR